METITMFEVYNLDDGWDVIGFTISDWDGNSGDNEFENWDGRTFIVENGIIVDYVN